MLKASDKKELLLGAVLLSLMIFGWYLALVRAPTESNMGEVYRIIFLHVPSAAVALGVAAAGLFIASLLGLRKTDEKYLRAGIAWSEVGLIFTILTLATGSIWGKPTWGTWWTWDARLTTTFLLAILFAGYLLLVSSLPPGRQRVRICSVLGIIIFIDVPVIYKSVSWWRTLHQPASLIEERGTTMSQEMLSILMVCLGFTVVFAILLWRMRLVNLSIKDRLDEASYNQIRV